jgi:hypothetical protein
METLEGESDKDVEHNTRTIAVRGNNKLSKNNNKLNDTHEHMSIRTYEYTRTQYELDMN